MMGNRVGAPQKIKNTTTIQFSNSTSGYISQGSEIRLSCLLKLHSQQPRQGDNPNARQQGTGRSICAVHPMEHHSVTRGKEIPPSATTQMDLKDITLSKVIQGEKDKHNVKPYIHGI